MKNAIYASAAAILMSSAILVGCDSPQKNVIDAKEDLHEAQAKLAESNRDSIQEVDWNNFKAASLEKIAANKATIAALKTKQYGKGASMDAAHEKQVAALEEKNEVLQRRIDDYEKYNSNWESFKREFDHDMEDLGKSLKDLTVNNSK